MLSLAAQLSNHTPNPMTFHIWMCCLTRVTGRFRDGLPLSDNVVAADRCIWVMWWMSNLAQTSVSGNCKLGRTAHRPCLGTTWAPLKHHTDTTWAPSDVTQTPHGHKGTHNGDNADSTRTPHGHHANAHDTDTRQASHPTAS